MSRDNATEVPLAPLPRNLLDAIQEAGVDIHSLARSIGLDARALETGMNFAQADRFMGAAWDALADPAFGLRAGRRLRPERFGVVGSVAMSSATLGEALERKARYNRLIWGDLYELERRGARATVRIAANQPPRPYSRARIDLELASILTFARLVTGREIAPLAVTITQAVPSYREVYAQVFGCPVSFGAQDDSIVFNARDLDLPLVSEDSEVGMALVRAAEARLGRLEAAGADEFRPRAAQALRRLLHGGEPTLEATARELHISKRTLQRRLAEHTLSYTGLLDEVRRDAALEYLCRQGSTAEEVAYVLGFATPSSFFRAFKRWTGQTPREWRTASHL